MRSCIVGDIEGFRKEIEVRYRRDRFNACFSSSLRCLDLCAEVKYRSKAIRFVLHLL